MESPVTAIFPRTLTFDDPAVVDELIVPSFSTATYPVGDGDAVNDTTYAFSFARLLTPFARTPVVASSSEWV